MKNRFVRWCVMVFGMVLAVACGHGQDELGAAGPGAVEHLGEIAQAVTLAFPPGPVASSGKVGTLPAAVKSAPPVTTTTPCRSKCHPVAPA